MLRKQKILDSLFLPDISTLSKGIQFLFWKWAKKLTCFSFVNKSVQATAFRWIEKSQRLPGMMQGSTELLENLT